MANETPRLGLGTFEQGDTDWDHTDAVEALDELAIQRGAIADRPATAAYGGAFYAALDQRILWQWDNGSEEWTAVAGLGSESEPLPTAFFEAIDAAIGDFENASVADAPTEAEGVARKAEIDAHEDSTTGVHGIEGGDSVAGVIDIETHRETEVHDEPQPAQTHGNEDHTETFAVDGDAQPPEEHGNEAHSETFAVDGDAQPPEEHGNEAHSETFVTNEEGVTEFGVGTLEDGEALVNEDGVLTGSDEIGGGDAETDIDLIEVDELDQLPDPEDVEDPTIAYVDEEDDYLGVFQE